MSLAASNSFTISSKSAGVGWKGAFTTRPEELVRAPWRHVSSSFRSLRTSLEVAWDNLSAHRQCRGCTEALEVSESPTWRQRLD